MRDLSELKGEGDSLSSYLDNFYKRYFARHITIKSIPRNRCHSGCPENTTCEWGLCQCEDPRMVQLWGECVLQQDLHGTSLEGTVSEETIVGKTCFDDAFCQEEDINTLCFRSNELVEGLCKCRHEIFIRTIIFIVMYKGRQEMQWNTAALECQVCLWTRFARHKTQSRHQTQRSHIRHRRVSSSHF